MSRPSPVPGVEPPEVEKSQPALDELVALLDLEQLEVNLFRGVSPPHSSTRVFGRSDSMIPNALYATVIPPQPPLSSTQLSSVHQTSDRRLKIFVTVHGRGTYVKPQKS